MQYRDRIVGLEYHDAGSLTPHPGNWRNHGKEQVEALRGVLAEVGIADTILAYRSERNGGKLTVIDGHLRRDAAPQQWPVLVLDVTDAEADYILATHDPLAAMANADAAALDALLDTVNSGDAAVQAMLAALAEDAGLYAESDKTDVDAEPQIDRAEELRAKWGVESGQLWQLGDHRLICGDCTDAAVVARVMGGEAAALAPVDPPYNVGFGYDGETVDDSKTADDYERFSRAWFGACQSVSERQIVTPGGQNLPLWVRWFDCFHIAAWTKPFSTTNGKVAHLWSWEPMFFFGDKWTRKRANDVFEYGVTFDPKLQGMHPCPKPIALWLDIIENYSELGDIIYEAFSGSGTTIIACEQLGRKCRAVEISPGYVAVALQRWADATGRTPELIHA